MKNRQKLFRISLALTVLLLGAIFLSSISGDLLHMRYGLIVTVIILGFIILTSSVYAETKEDIAALMQAAEKGEAKAQLSLGLEYYLNQENVDAEKWLRKAAEQGEVEAQAYLGDMYLGRIKGIPQDVDEAIKWLSKAAAKGNAFAQSSLAGQYLLKGNDVEAKEWYIKAAEQGDLAALTFLGEAYLDGDVIQGIAKNYEQAKKILLEPATQGMVEAQCSLGKVYTRQENYRESYFWFSVATAARSLSPSSNGCGMVVRTGKQRGPKEWMDVTEGFLNAKDISIIQERVLMWKPSNPVFKERN